MEPKPGRSKALRASPGRGSDVYVALVALIVAHEDQRLAIRRDGE